MIIKDENMLVAFVNAEQPPVKTKHICYYTDHKGDEISLCEVYEATYPHPEAPQDAIIPVTRTRLIRTLKRLDYDAASLILMEAQQKACRMIEMRM